MASFIPEPSRVQEPRISPAKVLCLLPAWTTLPGRDARWIHGLLKELGSRLGVVTACEPASLAGPRGVRPARRAARDFAEQVGETISEGSVRILLAVGEAANAANLELAAERNPGALRVILALTSTRAKRAARHLADLALRREDDVVGELAMRCAE